MSAPSGSDRRALIDVISAYDEGYGSFMGHYAPLADRLIATGFTRRPMPSRERLIGAIAGSECDWRDATPESIADAVLALFGKGSDQ